MEEMKIEKVDSLQEIFVTGGLVKTLEVNEKINDYDLDWMIQIKRTKESIVLGYDIQKCFYRTYRNL